MTSLASSGRYLDLGRLVGRGPAYHPWYGAHLLVTALAEPLFDFSVGARPATPRWVSAGCERPARSHQAAHFVGLLPGRCRGHDWLRMGGGTRSIMPMFSRTAHCLLVLPMGRTSWQSPRGVVGRQRLSPSLDLLRLALVPDDDRRDAHHLGLVELARMVTKILLHVSSSGTSRASAPARRPSEEHVDTSCCFTARWKSGSRLKPRLRASAARS